MTLPLSQPKNDLPLPGQGFHFDTSFHDESYRDGARYLKVGSGVGTGETGGAGQTEVGAELPPGFLEFSVVLSRNGVWRLVTARKKPPI